jgi:hypothetical protein
MARLLADHVAKAFNEICPSHWRARAYLKNRSTGVFNACKFTYKGGMVQLLMDCDVPIGQGFQIKFQNFTASFGDYIVAIQKALYQVLSKLHDADMAPNVPELLSPSEIMFGLRKDGAVVYLVIFSQDGEGVSQLNGPGANELTYSDDESQVADEIDTDELL